MEFLILIFAIVIILASFGYNSKKADRNIDLWTTFAERQGGHFENDASFFRNPANVGSVTLNKDGRELLVRVRVENSGENSVVYTRVQGDIQQHRDINITRTSFTKMFRGGRVTTGYQDFDERFVVFCGEELWARRVIALGVFLRERFLASDIDLSVELIGRHMIVERKGSADSVEFLEELLEFARQVAELLDNTHPPALGYEAEGRLSIAESEDNAGALTIASASGGAITSVDGGADDREDDS